MQQQTVRDQLKCGPPCTVRQGAAHDASKETKGYVETAKDKVNSLLGTGEKKANEAGDKANELGSKAGAHAEDAQKQGKSEHSHPSCCHCCLPACLERP